MAGTAPDCELNRGVRLATANGTHDADIRRLLRDNPMHGAVNITFEREPDYFRGVGLAGSEDQTIVAYENERLVCMGRCTQRDCWVNEQVTRTGYLVELRLDHHAQRRFAIVRDGYRFFHEQQDAALHFTSVAADNERARRLLERGVRGMPAYDFLGELVTLLIAVPRYPRPPKLRVEPANGTQLAAIVELLNRHGQRHQLAAVWSEENLHALAGHGLPLQNFLVARDGEQVIACGALWDQRSFRQTRIHNYAGALGLARPWLNVVRRLLGHPSLPPPGTVLAQGFLSPLALADGMEDFLPELVESFLPLAAASQVEWLTLALPAGDARLAALRRRFSTRSWPSRLYRVRWSGQPEFEFKPASARFLPDVALL
jgi:hypothetical protein